MKQVRFTVLCLVAVLVPTGIFALVFGLTARSDLHNWKMCVGFVLAPLFTYGVGKIAYASHRFAGRTEMTSTYEDGMSAETRAMCLAIDLKETRRRCAEYKDRAIVAECKYNNLRHDRTPNTAHLDRFFTHPCRDRLVRFFPNSKEVTESMAAFHAVNTHLRVDRSARDVTVIVVGDGHSPRTGALFAVSSNWEVWSVDPVLKMKHDGAVDRLCVRPDKIEDTTPFDVAGNHVIIVAVHSHALLRHVVEKVVNSRRIDVVSIPCCVPQTLDTQPVVKYEDMAILSPERTVLVWRDAGNK